MELDQTLMVPSKKTRSYSRAALVKLRNQILATLLFQRNTSRVSIYAPSNGISSEIDL